MEPSTLDPRQKDRLYLRVVYEKTMSQVTLGPLLGKQNIQAKQVY